MFESTDRRADNTRQQILRAAAHQFARRPYHDVGLDDILAVAELTKGAMYFHFRSKHALALAVIDEQLDRDEAAVRELLGRRLSGLENIVDLYYYMAIQDIGQDAARAVLRLLPAVGWTEKLQARVFDGWIDTLVPVVKRAVIEGDVIAGNDPEDLARLLVSLYLGLRQSGDLDQPERFLLQFERCWLVLLPCIASPDRVEYFSQFIKRRTALAIGAASASEPGH